MSTPSLVLVGTVHRSGGHRMLLDLLADLRPDTITLEMSRYALAFRICHGPSLLARLETILDTLAAETGRPREELARHPEIEGIRTLLALPFEYTAAAGYAHATAVPIALIDSSLISARKLRRIEGELLSFENVRILVDLPPAATTESAPLARALVHGRADPAIGRAFLAPRRGPEGIGDRDRRMAIEIRRLMSYRKKVVHIGGWVHLVDDEEGETLYSRLKDMRPERMVIEG
jgi:hypothetical protein